MVIKKLNQLGLAQKVQASSDCIIILMFYIFSLLPSFSLPLSLSLFLSASSPFLLFCLLYSHPTGHHAFINEKGTAAIMTDELDKEKDPQVHVIQGTNHPSFLQLFNISVI